MSRVCQYSEAGCMNSLETYLRIVDNRDRVEYGAHDYSPFQNEIRLHKKAHLSYIALKQYVKKI